MRVGYAKGDPILGKSPSVLAALLILVQMTRINFVKSRRFLVRASAHPKLSVGTWIPNAIFSTAETGFPWTRKLSSVIRENTSLRAHFASIYFINFRTAKRRYNSLSRHEFTCARQQKRRILCRLIRNVIFYIFPL